MTSIHDAYVNALLADASYVDDLRPNLSGAALAKILEKRMTHELAKYIGANFEVVTQSGNHSGLESSFDATVWKDKTGKIYVSTRGTQELFDFSADHELASTGSGHDTIDEAGATYSENDAVWSQAA
jgi:hypothetical protein